MRKIIGILLNFVILLLVSCSGKKPAGAAKAGAAVIKIGENKIVKAMLIDHNGDTLKLTFNNQAGTCSLELDSIKTELKQDTMASGIRYSNEHYRYSEWHGHTELQKDGQTIFLYDR